MTTGKHPSVSEPRDLGETVFAALITPHRSLGRRAFRLLMACVCLACLFSSIPFVLAGAWPIAGYFAATALAVYVAFRVNFRRARSFEQVVLTRIELLLRKVTWRGEAREWHFNPLWTRLERETDEDFGVQRLALVSRGQQVTVGSDLSAGEKETLGEALGQALAQVKRG